ncbi:MAG TPA: riboflavin synthase [Acidimicrobiales bacterium]|nr:riboflavin synthase [Acidimicrobiales bacterium]
MFTGIIEELGTIAAREGGRFTIAAAAVPGDLAIGDSVAVNGCCLTATEVNAGCFVVEAVAETLTRTTHDRLSVGDRVNLERPVRMTDRLGGHLVQGHVDGVGEVVQAAPSLEIRCDESLTKYIVEKGSITIDGISLTVVEVSPDRFTVAVIPHTMAVTTLGWRAPGDRVNLEVDVVAKYVERLLTGHTGAREAKEA